MAGYEFNAEEMERRFEEMLQIVEGGFEILISQGGNPLAQLVMTPIEHMMDFVRGEGGPFYAVIIEKGEHGYAAYVPDLPDCVAEGATEEEVETRIRRAMTQRLNELKEGGTVPPEPVTRAVYVQPAKKEAAKP